MTLIWPWLESVWQDARYLVRTCRRQPGFVSVVLLTLTVGIGATTATFSVVNAVLLRPAPYPEPNRMVIFGYTFKGVWVPWMSPAKFNVWRRQTGAFQDVSAYRFNVVNLTGGSDAEQIAAGQVSADFFRLFGAPVIAGRTFSADEDRPGGGHVVVLSEGFWKRRFGGDAGALGGTLSIDGDPYVVIGILGPFDTQAIRPPTGDPEVDLPDEAATGDILEPPPVDDIMDYGADDDR